MSEAANLFVRLLAPAQINSLKVKNHLITTAMVTNYCSEDGQPTERFIRYHEEKARGGWGLVITEDYAILPEGKSFKRLPGLWDDSLIAAHAELTRRVHDAGGRLCAQLFHPGRETDSSVTGEQPVAPSALKEPTMPECPRELTITEIQYIVEAFAKAAGRAKKAGFDAVEIHGAHGYLVSSFVSPFSNRRSDCYGGSIENRSRFSVEIVQAIRKEVGPDFPILYRMNVDDCVTGGITLAEAQSVARRLERAGVDLLNCSQGMYVSVTDIIPPTAVARGKYVHNAQAIKQVVSIPVSTVGRINDPDVAETILRAGYSDFISMGRAALADPHFPNKVARGKTQDIIQCIACCRGCVGENNRGHEVACVVNPLTGREFDYDLSPAKEKKKVVVVGAGISGCESALIAAKRGHEVVLIEATQHIGGQWRLASIPPGKEDFGLLPAWQEHTLRSLGVQIILGQKASVDIVKAYEPDVVIIATGSKSFYPPIPGLQDTDGVVDSHSVLSGNVVLHGKVAVLGGGLVGAETAELLASQGCKVTIVEMMNDLAPEAEPNPKFFLETALEDYGVKYHLGTRVTKIAPRTIFGVDASGEMTIGDLDSIVVALGVCSCDEVSEELKQKGFEVIAVGDAAKPRDAFWDIRDAFEVGLSI